MSIFNNMATASTLLQESGRLTIMLSDQLDTAVVLDRKTNIIWINPTLADEDDLDCAAHGAIEHLMSTSTPKRPQLTALPGSGRTSKRRRPKLQLVK